MKIFHCFVVVLVIFLAACGQQEKTFQERLLPIPKDSGFKMEGYWVWGGSAIKVGSTYHLFASRWPKKNKFPDDYFKESEIVYATASNPIGPYSFQKVIISERDSMFWDSNMAHNPSIYKVGDEYVLFYIGSDFTTMRKGSGRLLRRAGFATAKNIEGPWTRADEPVFAEESNNPALLTEEDGRVKLVFRDERLKVRMATAENFAGPYEIANGNLWPESPIEDFYLFKKQGKYHLVCEDNVAALTGHERWGAHLVSENGIDNWQKYSPVVVYDHEIIYENNDTLHCVRRERPQLLIQRNKITHLFNGVYDGQNSWCQPVGLSPALEID